MTLASSCMVGPDFSLPNASVEANWIRHSESGKSPGSSPDGYWWKTFQDPVLNRLVDSACRNNLTLQAAGTAVLQARAQLAQTRGNLFPQDQGLGGGVKYRRLNVGSGDSGDAILGQRRLDFRSPGGGESIRARLLPAVDPNVLSDNMLFSASWEIDFWGKYRREIQSADAGYLASLAAYEDALVTLQADVASTYINIRTLEERIVVNERNVETQESSLEIAQAQFDAGQTSELDVSQAQTSLAETHAAVPTLRDNLRQAKNGLAVLLGVTPDKVDGLLKGSSGIPRTPANVDAGIPRDLLRRRPDVREAGLNAASLSATIGVAKAQMYPAFSLSGTFGFSSSNIADASLADIFNWNHKVVESAGSFLWPVFNYGRLTNQVRIQDAQFQQAVLNYQNTVLTAQQEVENGLSAFRFGKQSATLYGQAAEAATRSTELAIIQYRGGETEYTTVLSAEQSQLRIEDSLASAKGNAALALVSVYRAVGGGWQTRSGQPVISEAVKEEMERRTNWGNLLEPENYLPKTKPLESANDDS